MSDSSGPVAGPPAAGRRPGVCGILVTHEPDEELLREVVGAAVAQLDGLVILDNGSSGPGVDRVRRAQEDAGPPGPSGAAVELRLGERNAGLPARFNEGIAMARAAGHRFVLFLDQDSVLRPGAVDALRSAFERVGGSVAVGALEAVNDEPERFPTDDFLEGHFRRGTPVAAGAAGLVDDYLATNSGLFVPLSSFDRVGTFDESFFLDASDFDFGLRLWTRGLRLLRVPAARIRHRRGESTAVQWAGARWGVRRVTPVRHYYVARDSMRTCQRYGLRFPLIGLYLLSMPFREAALVLLFYRDRRAHLAAIARGLVDWASGRTGPAPPAPI